MSLNKFLHKTPRPASTNELRRTCFITNIMSAYQSFAFCSSANLLPREMALS